MAETCTADDKPKDCRGTAGREFDLCARLGAGKKNALVIIRQSRKRDRRDLVYA
jgi:hypothetical protein